MIHPTAIIHADAHIEPSCWIGPYVVIDQHVRLGSECRLGPYVHITGDTSIGSRNTFHAGCVIGDAPQDLKYQNQRTALSIGNDNTIREHVTIHRSAKLEESTVIGNGNYLMAHSHVGHNCQLGEKNIIANGALLGGHVTVENQSFISGNCLIHQFVRIGTLALMQGGSAISKDLPPFTVAHGDNGLCGLNVVGLRRAGIPRDAIAELKRLYHHLFRQDLNLSEAARTGIEAFANERSRQMLSFIETSSRGICTHQTRRK